jgi:hypothetical protein
MIWTEFTPDPSTRHTSLSGVELAHNQTPTGSVVPTTMVFQTFRLPQTFKRGEEANPELTGLQFCMKVEDADEFTANILLEVTQFGDWVELARGAVVGTHAAGDFVWIDAYFNKPIAVSDDLLASQFRCGVESDTAVNYAAPPSLPNQTTINGGNLCFRLLTSTADSGVDFLGNTYRSLLRRSAVTNLSTVATDNANGFWMSKPNPSRFAVESLYFDVRDDNAASVVDRLLIDPITPGVYFNLYYSSEGEPGTTELEWEQKLWQPTFQRFHMQRREEHALTEPITAKYLKVEFTQLQPQFYSPGTFQQPIRYKKHPKWVLDYFVARADAAVTTSDPFVARNIRVLFKGLDLAYNYYLDDLRQGPSPPSNEVVDTVVDFLSNRTDRSDQIDAITMDKIKFEMQPYTRQPADRVQGLESLLADVVYGSRDATYPIETISRLRADISQVSTLDRMPLLVENDMAVMFFYVTARHTYRELEAYFEEDRAFFVGVRELAFTRDHYSVASDQSLYVDVLGDRNNLLRNDFLDYKLDEAEAAPVTPDEPKPEAPLDEVIVSDGVILAPTGYEINVTESIVLSDDGTTPPTQDPAVYPASYPDSY